MKTFITYTILFGLMGLQSLVAQDKPIIRCISLDDNDNITLSWEQPADTGADFNHYSIYYRTGTSGTFSELTQVSDYNQSSVLINGSFASLGQFYMVQVYNGLSDTSARGAIVRPIVPGLTSNGKVASVGWNPTGLPSADSVYRVFKLDTSGNYQLIRTLDFPLTAISDTIASCTEEVQYRIEVNGLGGCISRSGVVSGIVEDELPPEGTDILCASVDTATGLVNIEWEKSASPDAYGVLIFYFEDFVRSDTVFGFDSLSYTYDEFGINALVRPETLSVAPFDSCYDSLSNWYNQAADNLRFQTMFIDTSDYDRCSKSISLEWSLPRPRFPIGVRNLSGFHVYRKTNGQNSDLIATLAADDSTYSDSGLVAGQKYTYVVAPFDEVNDKEVLSNKVVVDLDKIDNPDYMFIKSIVNDHESGHNQVNLFTDTTSEAVAYGLYRSLDPDNGFMEVEREDIGDEQEFALTDESGSPGQTPYFYRIAAYDICGDIIARSQVARSMHISGEKKLRDLVNMVEWNAYEGYDTVVTEVEAYDLIRVTSGTDEELIYSSESQLSYTDEIVDKMWIGGNVCYYVEAPEATGNPFEISAKSVSNKLCFEYPPRVFIPNAFTPDHDGFNDIFLPHVNYIDPNAYNLLIYDRMGNLIYQTKDPTKGWDGQNQPIGVYAYSLTLTNARDEVLEYSGKIHLIR